MLDLPFHDRNNREIRTPRPFRMIEVKDYDEYVELQQSYEQLCCLMIDEHPSKIDELELQEMQEMEKSLIEFTKENASLYPELSMSDLYEMIEYYKNTILRILTENQPI
eukprot:NODE_904_length_3176_cov_0.518362.p4 type:complete len:109 gc:universal NODE_904_length_3176_cov_0.518362:1015-1341(+)